MVVQHNMQAANANRMLNVTTSAQSKSTEKLSSGYRINRAADDAAGLSISEKMRKQIRGLDKASSNAEDGVSSVQTAEGALTEVHSMLQRMNELAVQASNGTNSDTDRGAIQDEISQLTTEIDRVAETTKFNETYLLKGNTDGATSKVKLNAHDAGLAGKLTDNGNGTATFKADTLAVGDKVKIAGKEYTIGNSADSADYAKKGETAVNPVAAGDSVTSGNTTTSIVAKVTTATATATTWANGDKFKDADGNEWTVADATNVTNHQVASGEVSNYLKDGCTIVSNAANTQLAGTSVVDDLGKNEVSIADATGITALQNGIKAGDTVTVGGTTKTVTAETPKTYDEIKALTALDTKDTAVKIGSKGYKIGTSTDEATGYITKDDAELCNGSTPDSDSVCEGSNPSSAANRNALVHDKGVFLSHNATREFAMQVESCVQDGKTVAVITGTELVPTGAQSALDLIMTRAMRRTPASSQSKELRLRVWYVRMRYLCIEKASAGRQRLFPFRALLICPDSWSAAPAAAHRGQGGR